MLTTQVQLSNAYGPRGIRWLRILMIVKIAAHTVSVGYWKTGSIIDAFCCFQEVRVHRGMLRSARYVLDTLKEHNVLEDLRVLYPNYGITVCGHSLGAGVATLLTLLLK